MPITSGAKKTLRASKRKRVFNDRRRRTMREILKKISKLSLAGEVREAEKLISQAYKANDKAAKRGVIKKNTAARKKSRLLKSLNKQAK